jgi:multidrug resistance efflux pump
VTVSVEPNHTPPAPDGKNSTLGERVRSLRISGEPEGKSGGGSSRLLFLPWAFVCVLLLTTVAFGYRAYRVDRSMRDLEEGGESAHDNGKKLRIPGGYPGDDDDGHVGEVVLQSKGYVTPVSLIQLSPQTGGEIIWLDPNFREGAVYRKGDRLAEIDPVISQAQRDSALAALHVAQVNLEKVEKGSTVQEIVEAKTQLKTLTARLDLARIDYRNKRNAGSGTTRDELEKATAQLGVDGAILAMQKETVRKLELSLEEQRRICKSQVDSAKASLAQAEKQLKNCTIVAPTTGMILSKKAELGGYCNPLAFGAAGYLCEIADLNKLEIDLSIQERDVAKITQGMRCMVMPEAYQSYKPFLKSHPRGYQGVVSRLWPTADRAKGAVPVRVLVKDIGQDEAGKYLRPDMSAMVSFIKK